MGSYRPGSVTRIDVAVVSAVACDLTCVDDDVGGEGDHRDEVERDFVRMRPHFSFPTASPLPEPQAEQRSFERTVHGFRLIDEYAWLKAENWREVMRDPLQLDSAIRGYLRAENDYCERLLADTKSLRETLFCRNEGSHQGGRFIGARPRWAL